MLVTEPQAAKILCPFSRYFAGNTTQRNKEIRMASLSDDVDTGFSQPTCLGSMCMAWAWVDGEERSVYVPELKTFFPDHDFATQGTGLIPDDLVAMAGLIRRKGLFYKPILPQDRKGKCSRTFFDIEVSVNHG